MFGYRAKGVAALVGVAQCLLHLGALVCAFRAGWREGFLRHEGVFGGLCWSWAVGIWAEALWKGGRIENWHPSAVLCAERSLLAAGFSAAVGVQRLLGQNASAAILQLWLAHLAILAVSHWALPRFFGSLLFSDHHNHRVVVVGASGRVADLGRVLSAQRGLGYHPVGWMGAALESGAVTGLPFFGEHPRFEEVVQSERIDQVILAGEHSDSEVRQWRSDCERLGVRLAVARSFSQSHAGQFSWENRGEWMFGVSCREPLQNPFNRILKRLLDIAVAVPALVLVVLPVGCATWVAQRRQSPGPLFYRQWRHGRRNRPFSVWKFRTMHCNPGLAAVQARREDPRIYPFAAWLRRHSLDELPQFINVLTGEMSVVGPRPHFIEHTGRFSEQERYHVRSFVKPGITGLAQVNGCRGEVLRPEDMQRRVHFDIRYVEQWSLWLDVSIIARTVGHVLAPPETAY
jgi:exopolysaccharide biosynthesis polyprenyl glycosylphosphotransferase